ncbi:MAG: hypothetical protein JXR83_17970 [Deltaproteobacteria bacterium]|nr:hypothetical protein [Deltaproteobacteria bacterium]
MLAAALGALAACADYGNTLEGSISVRATLLFDRVVTEWVVDQLVIRYLSERWVKGEAARLTLDAEVVVAGVDIPVDDRVRIEHFITVVTDGGEYVQEPPFPQVRSGKIHFEEVSDQVDGMTRGSFAVIFDDNRTLNGKFEAYNQAPGQ